MNRNAKVYRSWIHPLTRVQEYQHQHADLKMSKLPSENKETNGNASIFSLKYSSTQKVQQKVIKMNDEKYSRTNGNKMKWTSSNLARNKNGIYVLNQP